MTPDHALQPIQRILVAGPPVGGLGTVEAAIQLGERLGARVRVLQVQQPRPILDRLRIARPPAAVSDADVVRLARRAGLRPSTLETETLRGQPRRVLLDEAKSWRADLVVLGRGAQEPPGVRLGTVADHLVRHLACPVLIVDDRCPVLPSRVIFPVDLSDFARTAMACGLGFLRQTALDGEGVARGALFVVPSPGGLTADKLQSIERAGEAELSAWLGGLPGAAAIQPVIAIGEPAAVIVERAADGADLVIMGTHGYGSLGAARRGVGSVTGEVLSAGPCSMLIVPPDAELGAEIAEAVVSETRPRFDERSLD